MSREFSTLAVLSVVSERLLCPFADVHEVLDYMSGMPLMTHQLVRVQDAVRALVVEQAAPFVGDLRVPDEEPPEGWRAFASAAVEQVGETIPLTPAPEGTVEVRDPIAELIEKLGGKPVILVTANGDPTSR